jgi:hypothetical protein
LLQRIKKTLVSADDDERAGTTLVTGTRRRNSVANGRLNGRAAS